MGHDILEKAVSRVLESDFLSERIKFLWHAGEPLAAGIDFYRKAVFFQGEHNHRNIKIINSIQTNATLINEQWCQFLLENHFSVGVSIDGPSFLHDRNRVNWGGRGTHAQTMRGFRLLEHYGLSAGALAVLTRESLDYPDEIFHFFVDNGFKWVGFNIEEMENANLKSSLKGASSHLSGDTVDAYRNFMTKIYDLWRRTPGKIEIREFSDILSVIERKQSDPTYARQPDETVAFGIITIQKNGDISTYSPEFAGSQSAPHNNFVIGNILDDSLDDLPMSSTFKKIELEVHELRSLI